MTTIIYVGERAWDKLVWGLILIGLGTFFLLTTFGIIPGHIMSAWWPVFVIAAAVGSLLSAHSPRQIGSAVSMLGIGTWLLIAANDWLGLGWARSWPLALVAVGFGSLVQAVAHAVRPRKEDSHGL